MLGYLLFTLTCFVAFRKMNTTHFEWPRIFALFTIAAAFLSASYLTNTTDLVRQISFQILLTVAYLLTLAVTPLFSTAEKASLRDEIVSRYRSFKNQTPSTG